MNLNDLLFQGHLLVFGAGGHGKVVADAALLCGAPALASDRNPVLCHGELLPGVRLVGVDAVPAEITAVHVAIGNNLWRKREADFFGHVRLRSVIHPAAVVAASARLGAGSFVAALAVVAPDASLGVGAIVNHGAIVDHDCTVGAFCHVAPHATLGGAVRLGQRVLVGSGAVVLPGVEIGDDVVVGGGAVVRHDLREAGTYVGVPARRIA
ncbi:NeuD/PglB/VioB family sugar acetyltransferase [Polaromonas aquatica]|uniref:NeuD/PglB/VioB family sugar acetyltransferase n=1 Tax=Polaromonas aquatica TaxID=332657 RepID=UPI003D6483BD